MMADSRRFEILDVVRFLAAFWVMLYHYSIYMESDQLKFVEAISRFGYLGVNLFFMISGFVIMLSADGKGPLKFAYSRFIRLYPTFWICLVITVSVSIFTTEKTYSILQVILNATMANNYLGVDNIDGVYWTLQAELKFYLCIFLLILFGLIKHIKVWLLVWLTFVVGHYFTGQPGFLGWFINPGYSSYFIAGVCFYMLLSNRKLVYPWVVLFASAALSIANIKIQIAEFLPNHNKFDVYLAMTIVAIFYMFFIAVSVNLMRFKSNSMVTMLGLMSYPMYLIHNVSVKSWMPAVIERVGEIWSLVVSILYVILISYIIVAVIEPKLRRLIISAGYDLNRVIVKRV